MLEPDQNQEEGSSDGYTKTMTGTLDLLHITRFARTLYLRLRSTRRETSFYVATQLAGGKEAIVTEEGYIEKRLAH
jgi:hypothetical protein